MIVVLMSETKNELEDLLEKAATEPAHRRPFSVLYWNPPSGCQVRRRRARLWLKIARLIYSTGKKKTAPALFLFFTSLEALQQAVEDEQAFVVMPVRTLFEMTLGEKLFLNAKLPTSKEFMPREISLLIGEEGNPLSSQEILEGGESLILSEVAEPPAQMIDSLTTLFKTIKPVKRALFVQLKRTKRHSLIYLLALKPMVISKKLFRRREV